MTTPNPFATARGALRRWVQMCIGPLGFVAVLMMAGFNDVPAWPTWGSPVLPGTLAVFLLWLYSRPRSDDD